MTDPGDGNEGRPGAAGWRAAARRKESPGGRARAAGWRAAARRKESAGGGAPPARGWLAAGRREGITRRRLPAPLAAIAAALFLTLALAFHNIWPTPWIRLSPELSVEAAVVVLLVALLAGAGLAGRRIRRALVALLFLLVAGRYGDVVAPALFGRPVNLYWDLPHAPRVAAMALEIMPGWQVAIILAGAVLALALLLFALGRAVGALFRAFARPLPRRVGAGLAALVIAVYAAGMASDDIHTERRFAIPVSFVYARQAALLAEALDEAGRPLPGPVLALSDFGRLAGGDLLVVFFESYGAMAWLDPARRTALAADIATLDEVTTAAGWQSASALVRSPTFGGISWLAHTTLLSGLWIDGNGRYQRLLRGDRETLVDRARSAGYRTVTLVPGIRREWPEGVAQGWDRIMDGRTLDWRGPAFGWWRIPDQYSIDRMAREELTPRAASGRAPVFMLFPTIMSHMPFSPTPPCQPDWERLAGDRPFDGAAPVAGTPWHDLGAAWQRTMRYNFCWIGGFLANRAPGDALVMVLGDHQPPAIVSGEAAPWTVPVHVFSRRPALLEPFLRAGFLPGMRPGDRPVGRMDALTPLLLGAIDSAGGARPGLAGGGPERETISGGGAASNDRPAGD